MADGMYVGMSSAATRAAQLDAIADNLANAQTPGFRASRLGFGTFVTPDSDPTTIDKLYSVEIAAGVDRRAGITNATGNPLHLAVEGDAYFSVQLRDGRTAYTRDGRVSVDPEGRLRLGPSLAQGRGGGTIVVPPGAVPQVTNQGAVTVRGVEVGRLGLFQLSGPVDRVGPTVLAPGNGGEANPVDGRVRIGELELSNSNPLDATIQLIAAQRHFDTSMQAVQTYKKMDERAIELGRSR